MPRMSPSIATGGNSRLPQQARRSRGRTTGYTKPSRTTNRHQPVKVMHWNAERVLNKQTDLQHVLHENNITICCIQETHLQPKQSFKVRGYQCFEPTEYDWGYDHIDKRGEEVENWQDDNKLNLINKPGFLLQTMAHYIHTRPCILHRRLRWAN